MARNRTAGRLALGAALTLSALAASAAEALQFTDGDLIIIVTKDGTDAMYDFGGSIAPGTTKTFTLPTGTGGFLPGASGALSEGAVANAMGVPHPGLQETDGVFGVVPVADLRFSTSVSNPQAAITDTAIAGANTFLQASPAPVASGWLPMLSMIQNPIASSANSVVLPTSRTGSYSNLGTGPGNAGQDTIAGNLPFKTSATIGAHGSLLFPLYDASQGYVSIGGTIEPQFSSDGTLQFSESGGILTVKLLAVPEPSALILVGVGMLGLAGAGRRRAVR